MRINNRQAPQTYLSSASVPGTHDHGGARIVDPASALDLGAIGHKISVKPRDACEALSIGPTKRYELLNAEELLSYREDGSRKILVSSIRDYIARRIAASRKTTTVTMLLLGISTKLFTLTVPSAEMAMLSTEPPIDRTSYSQRQRLASHFIGTIAAGRPHGITISSDPTRA